MIQTIYDDMWQRFEFASNHNKYELDPHLSDTANDTRRGITALAYLNQAANSTIDRILDFQKMVQLAEPEQYYHPLNELHLTVLSVISCVPDFTLTEIEIDAYVDVFRTVLKGAG